MVWRNDEQLQVLDEQIISLINQRYEIASKNPPPELATVFDIALSDDDITNLQSANQGPMHRETLEAIYREIISGQAALVRPATVAFLGPEASFTHQATLQHFGESVRTEAKTTIADIFSAVEKGHVHFGVVPVENSTEGAVTHTFDKFLDSSVKICSEINMDIHHHLLSRSTLDRVEVIYSHAQPFGQCRRWLQENLPNHELVEVSSTAMAAERASREAHSAAIAGMLAAEKYHLDVLQHNIEDMSDNVTRFLTLGMQSAPLSGTDKTSVMIAVKDRVGALYDALLPFKNNDCTMTMIQSRPSRTKNWDYVFFVDFLGHVDDDRSLAIIEALKPECQFVKHLGSYPCARR